MDPTRSFCPDQINSTAILDYTNVRDYEYGDYSSEGLPATGEKGDWAYDYLSCLQYGAPYISSGFALMSVTNSAPFDVMSSLFNADVCNAVTVIVVIACSAGFLVSLLEKQNPHMGTFSRGAYWGLMTFLNSAEEHPRRKPARLVMIVYMLANLISLSIITSIISAKLTTASLSVTVVDKMSDVKGTLCVESNYDVLMQYVQRDPAKPVSIIELPIDACIGELVNGTVAAVVTDRTVLSWYAQYYAIPGLHLSPVLQSNPFAFVYKDATLLQYVNPAVIAATQTDSDWIPATLALQVKYFGAGDGAAPGSLPTEVNMMMLIVAAAMAGFALLIAFINGDWATPCGEGLPFPWVKKYLGKPSIGQDMSDEDAALAGDDQAMVRVLLKELREIRENMQAVQADLASVKARVKSMSGGANSRPASELAAAVQKPTKRIDAWAMSVVPEAPPAAAVVGAQDGQPVQRPRGVPPTAAVSSRTIEPTFCGLPSAHQYRFPVPFSPAQDQAPARRL